MSDDIKVGDLCEIVNSGRYNGRECTIVQLEQYVIGWNLLTLRNERVFAFEIQMEGMPCNCYAIREQLRKKPPKQKDDAEPRTDFTPADPSKWEFTHWHPNKVKELVS